jgi:transcriptional regulator with XRE-family HTH domain
MTGKFITQLRRKLLDITQAEMARALEVSPVTLNRWENDDPRYRPSAKETRLLEAMDELVGTIQSEGGRRELLDLLRVSTVAGVIGKAAMERLLKTTTITLLAATPGLGWLGLVADIGVGAALPFFSKGRAEEPKADRPGPVEMRVGPAEKASKPGKRRARKAVVEVPAPAAPQLYSLSIETL